MILSLCSSSSSYLLFYKNNNFTEHLSPGQALDLKDQYLKDKTYYN